MLRNDYWPVHRRILQVVQPEVIIAFGNGPYHPISISLTSRNKGKADSIDSGHGNFTCLSFESKIENQLMTVIGLPHLSRYHLYTDKSGQEECIKVDKK
jgi:hypothetical protein